MAGSSRDARRRRILEGSQDRLALITGRVQNIPSTSSQSITADDDAQSQQSVSENAGPKPDITFLESAFRTEVDKPLESTHSKDDGADEANESNTYASGSGNGEEQTLRRRGVRRQEPSRTLLHASDAGGRTQEALSNQKSSPLPVAGLGRFLSSLGILFRSATVQQLSSALSVTEHTRLRCSVAMGILVLLCHLGFPVVGSGGIKTIVLFRPLWLLLVVNVMLIASKLLLSEPQRCEPLGPDGWADAGRALELAWMLINLMYALFMDSSVYAATIICGFCLA